MTSTTDAAEDGVSMVARRFVVGLAGGSGARYALRLIEVLLRSGAEVEAVVSRGGRRVLLHECGLPVPLTGGFPADLLVDDPSLRVHLTVHDLAAVEARPASGSARIDGVVLVPCSMGTLARVAHGLSTNLLERAADVALKERRKLVVVPRETPLSVVHLRNMLLLAEAGAIVLPAMPGFYQQPETVQDLVDFVVARILDSLGVDHELVRRWSTPESSGAVGPFDEGEDPLISEGGG